MKRLSLPLLALLPLLATAPLAAGPAEAVRLPEAASLEERLRITIEFADAPGVVPSRYRPITYQTASEPARAAFMPLFLRELGFYPADFIARVGLRRVVLCGAIDSGGQRVSGVPGYEDDTLYLDVDRPGAQPSYKIKTIHHELFHMADYADDGQVYKDAAWAALNPPEFRYGDGGRSRLGDPIQGLYIKTLPGFLTTYATSGVEEDKAEVFSSLMLSPTYVNDRTYADPVVKMKVERMKTLLLAISSSMGSPFWNAVESVRTR